MHLNLRGKMILVSFILLLMSVTNAQTHDRIVKQHSWPNEPVEIGEIGVKGIPKSVHMNLAQTIHFW